MILVLSGLMMGDYLLTYWGMSMGYVTEGNGIMRWLMQLPLVDGLVVKTFISAVLLVPIALAGRTNRKLQRVACYIVLGAYTILYVWHGCWIYLCLTI